MESEGSGGIIYIKEASEEGKMKNLKSKHIKLSMITVLFIWTIASLVIVFKNIVGDFTIGVVVGNIFLLVIVYLYLLIDSILKLIKLDSKSIKDRGFKFIVFFILLAILNFILYYFTKAKGLGLSTSIPVSIILSLGISLFDLSFITKIKEDDKDE